ncbi:MAG: hypothetical protein KAU36_08960, partial [candidate division Zixibacteria bacterium]|nr:hypothetical protein [candidate division Zixibacteria bacterium]
VNISLDSLAISAGGVSGTVSTGEYTQIFQPLDEYLVDTDLSDAFNFKVGGVVGTFGTGSDSVCFSGDIQTSLFSSDDQPASIHYVAKWEGNQFEFYFDANAGLSLPLAIATFTPQAIGEHPAFGMSISADEFALTLSGVLQFPEETFGDGMAISIAGLSISTVHGVTVPEVSVQGDALQQFELFGSDFALKDIEGHPAMAFAYEDRVFYLSLSGEINFFDNVSTFWGFKVGTDGSFDLGGVDFINNPQGLYLVDEYLALTRLGIESSSLLVSGFARFPEPCDTARQVFNVQINPDGSIEGDAKFLFINDVEPGLNNDETELPLWVATFDPTYAALGIEFGNRNAITLEMIADIYFMSDEDKWVRLGQRSGGQVVAPGLVITYDGDFSLDWGPVQVPPDLFDADWESLKLDFTEITMFDDADEDFSMTLSGSLNINLGSCGGGVAFSNWHLTASGGIEDISIDEGYITITDIVTVTVGNIGFSSSPTTLEVSGGASCEEQSGETAEEATVNQVEVESYFAFGASIDISGVGGGGIDQFLTYVASADHSTHVIIENAWVSIVDVVEFHLDMSYEQSDAGFALLMGGTGELMGGAYGFAVVGKIAHLNGETSFGLFVAADVSITIPPCLVLTSVGGGFFYNPTVCDIELVRSVAGFGGLDEHSNDLIQRPDPGSFAILLYGEVTIINEYLISGKVLVTITEGFFRVDGRVVVLGQDGRLEGTMYLEVGFTSVYAQGGIWIEIEVGDFLTGNASMDFFIVEDPNGSTAWAINGHIDVKVLMVLDATADLFVGNPGFMIAMSMT